MKKSALGMVVVCLLAAPAVWAKVGGGEVKFDPKGASPVIYNHEAHVIKAGIKCSECHYNVFNTKEAKKAMTMAQMEKGRGCGSCHNGTKAFDIKANCERCHK